MATLENSRLAGSPIIFTVAAPARAGVTFQRILLDVTVSGDGKEETFQFSSPTADGNEVSFDISSAVRALADSHVPTATDFNYPAYNIAILAKEEYMIDGEMHQSELSNITQSGDIYIGAYTDADRLFNNLPAVWSRKPFTSQEICFTGYLYILPGTRRGNIEGEWIAPSAQTLTIPEGRHSGFGIYGIPAPADGYELRFINSLGVHENVFLTGLPIEETNIQTDQYAIARQETLTRFSRRIALKQNDHEVWHMSTPPLDRQWQQWYLHEVLTARWAWLHLGEQYVPVNILPGESVKGRNRQEASPLTVEFDIEFDINGSVVL